MSRAGRGLVLGAVAALTLVACSSSSKSSTSPTTAAGPATTSSSPAATGTTTPGSAATGTPYTIGVISSDTGVGGSSSDISTTVHNWVNYTNSHGGVNGHPVKLMYNDDGDNAAKAAAAAQSLISSHVLAIMDASFVNNAFQKSVDAAKIPVLSLTGSGQSTLYFTDPNFYPNSTTVLANLYAQVYAAKYAKATTYALLYCAEDPNCAQAVPLTKTYGKAQGVDVNYTASISAGAPNYTAQCLSAKSAGSQAMFIAASNAPAIERVANDCATQNYTPVQITASGTVPDSALTKPGFNKNNVYGEVNTFPYFLNTTPATKLFHQVMDRYLAKAQRPTVVAAVWTGMELFSAAAANAGNSPTAQSIYQGLYAFHGNTLGGLAPPLTYKVGQPANINCFFLIRSQDGKYVAPNGDAATCVNLPKLG
jgi:branched-chain amino acid transport system substrate-binding protein